MQMESQVSLNHEASLNQGNTPIGDGNLCSASSGLNNVASQPPDKKPTRQWAAWTHQEEESFFTALRQVGKNFEKITSRVQSKNKDQVRHYYYRLVRRMNKLLGPELSLDAKNPKDTNAAMLRWWSLLEKYSCKASKLHLKPRRFKLFIEALEHQLLKDRKKNIRKRTCQGESFSSASLGNFTNQSRERGADSQSFKLIFVDSQNIQKFGHGKGSIKHNDGFGLNDNDEKEDTTAGKSSRQRRKPGVTSSAAYRKWEKAAMAGVSLVADAAEHLERTLIDKDCEQGIKGRCPIGRPPRSLHSSDQTLALEIDMQSAVKLKLQLFPMDDGTRRALEMDKHNPHLELTLSNRKKISSVLEHLNRKWGNSSAALGELMLFPYSARKENVMCHQRWTQDSFLNAADVYSMLGSPPVFRLRYGWFIRTASGSLMSQAPALASCPPVGHDMVVENRNGHVMESVPVSMPSNAEQSGKFMDPNHNLASDDESHAHQAESQDNIERSVSVMNALWNRKEAENKLSSGQLQDPDDMHLGSGNALSAGEWADSLTDISVGDLLCDVPENIDAECVGPPSMAEGSQCLQQIPFSSDSFDAAIAAHILRHQNKSGVAPTSASHSSSIWGDEETRDAFSFQKIRIPDVPGSSSSGIASHGDIEKVNAEAVHLDEESPDGDPMDDCPPDTHVMETSGKTLSGLADVSWPDSLGPLDLDIRSSKYNSEDLILNDSLGGLSRLIASSLDTFQNCSLFGFDKKDQASIIEP